MTLMLLMNLDFAGGGGEGAGALETTGYAGWQSAVVCSGWLLGLLVQKAVTR